VWQDDSNCSGEPTKAASGLKRSEFKAVLERPDQSEPPWSDPFKQLGVAARVTHSMLMKKRVVGSFAKFRSGPREFRVIERFGQLSDLHDFDDPRIDSVARVAHLRDERVSRYYSLSWINTVDGLRSTVYDQCTKNDFAMRKLRCRACPTWSSWGIG
jgi:hypothetical protein